MRKEVDGWATYAVVVGAMVLAASAASVWAALGFVLSAALFPLLAWVTVRR